MRIAYLVETFPSPTEYFVLNEIRHFLNRGVQVFVFALKKNRPALESLSDIPIYYLPDYKMLALSGIVSFSVKDIKKSVHEPNFFKNIRDVLIRKYWLRQINRLKIDHIHAHFGFVTTTIAACLSEASYIPFSCTLHAQDIYFNNNRSLQKKLATAKFVITCTEYNRQYLIQAFGGHLKGKLSVVYHGINLQEWQENKLQQVVSSQSIKVIAVGRLVEKKGFIYLLQAVKILKDLGRMIECTIIGDGPLRKDLELYCLKNGIDGNVKFSGYISQKHIRSCLAQADIFILPCVVARNGDRDGIPNVLLEALASGLPVISTNVSAIPELITNEENGLLVEQRNANALAQAIIRLCEDSVLFNRLRNNSRKSLIKKFDSMLTTDHLLALFDNAINE